MARKAALNFPGVAAGLRGDHLTSDEDYMADLGVELAPPPWQSNCPPFTGFA